MTAELVAVMPIIMLLVTVATFSGTFIARFISGTLTMPPPTPTSAETTPANTAPTVPNRNRVTWEPGPPSVATKPPDVPTVADGVLVVPVDAAAATGGPIGWATGAGVVPSEAAAAGPATPPGGGPSSSIGRDSSVFGASRRRSIVNATYPRRSANRPSRTGTGSENAMSPPSRAPHAVNSSSTIPSRRLATCVRRYTPAPALDVTITETSEIATAPRNGSPNPSVSSGTRRIPPPRPRRLPNSPTPAPPISRTSPAIIAAQPEPVGPRDGASGGPSPVSGAEVLGRVREQGHVAGSLQGDRQLALVRGAGPGLAPRLDLRALRQVAAEAVDLLVVDLGGLVGAERADLAAPAIPVVVVALLRAGRHALCLLVWRA